jgi:hypothetical protein
MKKHSLQILAPLALASVLSLTGCLGDSSERDADAGSVELAAAGSALFELPSALQAVDPSVESGALAKTSVLADSVAAEAMEPYRLVPGFVYVAESAKEGVKSLIADLAAQEWPDEWEGTNEDGYLIRTLGKDTALDGESDLRFRSLSMSKDGENVLYLSYFKNARGQFSGTFVWRSEAGDSTRVLVRFNGRNAQTLGERMVVMVRRGVSSLENVNAPSVVRVVAVRKEARVALSALTYHPTWQDADGGAFWGEGPKVFGVRAVANTEKDVALLKVAFADTLVKPGTLFQDYLLDDVTRSRAAVRMRALMTENDTLNKLVWWSLKRGKSLHAAEANVADGLDFLAFTTAKVPADLTEDDACQAMRNSKADILSGSDQELKGLYWSMTLEQPILLGSGARIVGAGSVAADFGLDEAELTDDSVELPELADVLDTTALEFPAQ